MSYNMTLAFFPRTTPSDIGELEPKTTSFDEASSKWTECASAATIGGNTLVVDPLGVDLLEPSSTPPPDTVVVSLSGVADIYIIQTYGDDPRLRVFTEYEIVEDEGTPLPAESVLDEYDDPEDAHLAFFCRVAGITLDDLWAANWSPIELSFS